MTRILGALSEDHGRGIVHRPLLAEDVFLEADAVRFRRKGARPSHADPRLDVFAAGLLLYEMISGTRPPGRDYPRPSSLRPDLPPPLEDVIVAALRVDPDARTPS